MMLDTGWASGDEDRRVHWSVSGVESVTGGGVSLWSSAQETEYLENVGLGSPISNVSCTIIRLEDVSTQRL